MLHIIAENAYSFRGALLFDSLTKGFTSSS